MKGMKGKFFAALLACALCAGLAPGGALVPERAWADEKIDAANFPDENFRQWVKENVAGGKDVLTDAQIAAVEEMDLDSRGISSLKGLERFTALKTLNCSWNELTELDLSHNPALKELFCDGNELTELDLSKNPALRELHCQENSIRELDLSKNEKLWEAALPAGAQATLPNGDRIAAADFQPRRTAGGKYRLDLSKHAGKIEGVKVTSEPDEDEDEEEEKDVEVTSSGGIYTFDPCDGKATISYKLGERDGKDWLLSLLLDVTKDTSDVPMAE